MSDNVKQESIEISETKEQVNEADKGKAEAANEEAVKKALKEKKKEKHPADPAKKKKRRKMILFVVIGVLVLLFILSKLFGGNGAAAVVTTTQAQIGDLQQTIDTSGTVKTEESKVYFSDVDVKVGEVKVQAGDAVKAGDVLLNYDADDLAEAKERAELKKQSAEGNYLNSVQTNNEKLGDLSEASTNLEVLDQQIADTEAYIKNLEAKISKKKSDLAHEGALLQISLIDWQDQPDSDEYQNLQKLVQINNYEQQNNEQIKSWQDELDVYNDMLSKYKEYRSEMKSQKSSAEAGKLTGGAKEELEANNKTQTMDVEDSLDSLSSVENGIVAEFDGVVTEMNAVEGGATAKGAQLLKLESTEDVMVRISVTKYDLSKIKEGQKAIVTIGSKEYEGEVSKINKMAEQNNSGASVVGTEIKILNPDSDVILGVEAKVVINTEKVENAVLVPITAVNVDMDGEFVYVVENSILVKKPVTTGISTDTMEQIVEGLSGDEQIVTSVTADLYEGMTVAAMPQ